MTMQGAKLFLENYSGETSQKFIELPKSGSERVNYYAEVSNKPYIVTYNENLRENESFFYFSEIFKSLCLNTPEIFSIHDNRKLYIQDFLGEHTLSQIIESEGLTERTKILVKQTLEKLYELQSKTKHKIDYQKTFEYERYDELPITHDLYYFKNFLVDVLELHYHKSSLLKEFKKLTSIIENLSPKGLMIRDFQARNILVNQKDEIFFIDYQSAMEGPVMYDVVSFLYQAKANFPESFRQEMLQYYFSLYENEEEVNSLKKSLPFCMLIRFLQVLGAYGFRGVIQRKPHFLASLHQGILNIKNFADSWQEIRDYPELYSVITELSSDKIQVKISALTQ